MIAVLGMAWRLAKGVLWPTAWGLRAVVLPLLVCAAVAGGLVLLHRHGHRAGYAQAQAAYEAELDRLHTQAAAQLLAATQKTQQAERALHHAKNLQEIIDAQAVDEISRMAQRWAQAAPGGVGAGTGTGMGAGTGSGLGAGQLGPLRLRDPHASSRGCSGGGPTSGAASPAGAGAADPPEAAGVLSEELARLLRALTIDADQINAAYASCRADAYTVRGVP